MAHTLILEHGNQRQADICEFKPTIVYTVNFFFTKKTQQAFK